MIILNGFAQHNIQHLSPSQINTWINDPAAWILQKLYHKSWPYGFSAKRGIAIENAIVNVLLNGHSEESAITMALEEYDRFGILSTDPKKEKERAVIAPSVILGLQELKSFGTPVFAEGNKQHKITVNCVNERFTMPVIGYLDLVYPDRKLIIDIKTTGRMPSEMSSAHARQAAIYEASMPGYEVKFIYITPKKTQFLSCPSGADALREIKTQIIRQEAFLSISPDREVLAGLVPVNPDTFYYDTPEAVRDRMEIYGI